MKRRPPTNRTIAARARVQPTPQNAELALREVPLMMAPLVRWLIRHGVTYAAFAEILKVVFVDVARQELEVADAKATQSALSLLSGVHRKDVREMEAAPAAATTPRRRPPLSSQVFTRWITDPRYRARDGTPRALPRTGGRRSFESLCRELSNDVHPRTVLDELLRLGHVDLQGERVVLRADSFIPAPHLEEMTALFAANVSDHAGAAVSNLTTDAPRFLEQSVYADGLTADSVDVLHLCARAAWAKALESVVLEARERVDRDKASDGEQRIRFGAYFFSESAAPASSASPPPDIKRPRRRVPAKKSRP